MNGVHERTYRADHFRKGREDGHILDTHYPCLKCDENCEKIRKPLEEISKNLKHDYLRISDLRAALRSVHQQQIKKNRIVFQTFLETKFIMRK